MWVIGIEPGSSGRAAIAGNHWATSPAGKSDLFNAMLPLTQGIEISSFLCLLYFKPAMCLDWQIAACLPERWFENSAMRTSIPQLENFIKFLLQSAQKLSSSEFRNEVSEIILILVKVKALTQAESLREERPLEPLPAQSTGVWVRRVGVPRVKMTVSQPMPPLLGAHLGCGQASWCFVAEGSNAQQQPSSVCCSLTLSIRKEMKQSDTQKHAWIKTIFSKLQCLQIS